MKYKLSILTILILFPIILFSQQIKNSKGKIKLIDKECGNQIKDKKCACICKCKRQEFSFNRNIYLEDNSAEIPYEYEECKCCSYLKLVIENTSISLDSIYYSNCKNKKIVYVPGFYEGKYLIKENLLTIELIFINERINSSRPTDHIYTIKYDLKENKLLSTKMVFDESGK